MIGDDPGSIASALKEAITRKALFIIVTGGLGPSEDDITVDSIGKALGYKTTIDGETEERIKAVYRKRGITDAADFARGRRMARILERSEPMRNPVGFAVGMRVRHSASSIFTLPGVPSETRAMFDAHIAPLIEKEATSKRHAITVYVSMIWKEFFPLYRTLQKEHPDLYIKNAATPPVREENRDEVHTIKVDIVVEAPTVEEAMGRMDAFLAEYQKRINVSGGGKITVRTHREAPGDE